MDVLFTSYQKLPYVHRKVIFFSCFDFFRHKGSLSWYDILGSILLDTSLGCQGNLHIATLMLLDDFFAVLMTLAVQTLHHFGGASYPLLDIGRELRCKLPLCESQRVVMWLSWIWFQMWSIYHQTRKDIMDKMQKVLFYSSSFVHPVRAQKRHQQNSKEDLLIPLVCLP